MSDLNVIVMNGRLAKDATVNEKGTIATTTLAVNRNVKVGDKWESEPSFFILKLFSFNAKRYEELKKGKFIGVEGELVEERWEKDGDKRSRVVVHVHRFQHYSPKNPIDNRPQASDNGGSKPVEPAAAPVVTQTVVENVPF